jgi:hypothetical protein
VTLEYESYSRKSAPVNPTIVRIRTDVRWEDVVAEFVISDSQNSGKSKNILKKINRRKKIQDVRSFTVRQSTLLLSELGSKLKDYYVTIPNKKVSL